MEPAPAHEPPPRGLFTLADLRRAAIRGVFVGLGAALLMMLTLGLVVFSPGITLGFVAVIVVGTSVTCGLGAIPPSLVEIVAARRPASAGTYIAATAFALGAAAAGFIVAGVQLAFAAGFLMGRSIGETIDRLAIAASFDGWIIVAIYTAQFAIPCALVAGGRLQGGPRGRPSLQAMLWNLVAAAIVSVPLVVVPAVSRGLGRDWLACCGPPLMALPGVSLAVCYAIADAIDARIARRAEAT